MRKNSASGEHTHLHLLWKQVARHHPYTPDGGNSMSKMCYKCKTEIVDEVQSVELRIFQSDGKICLYYHRTCFKVGAAELNMGVQTQ